MKSKKKLGEILVDLGFLTRESLEDVLTRQKRTAKRLGELLLEMRLLKKGDLVRALADQCEMPFLEKLPEKPEMELAKLIPIEFMQRYQLVPFGLQGNHLKAATVNPQSLLFIDSLRLTLKLEIDLCFTTPEEVSRLMAVFDRARLNFPEGQKEIRSAPENEKGALIYMVRHLVLEAMRQKASDIHLEMAREKFSVRYRIDGILHATPAPAKELSPQVVSRIKVLAGLDLAEKRVPQDGRIRFEAEGQWVDLRVSIIPSLHGESVVLRILGRRNLRVGLGELGFLQHHLEVFKSLIGLPYGMILVTGPTGSGKTTTLYGALETLNHPGEKIITVEDPIEYEMDGVNQVQVKPSIGLDFSQTLRAMLRQAPTIILVGEIRDLQTAEIAVQAALTGHLVFSTLHTNDAVSAIPRLIDLGVKPYLVAASLQGVIAQRLVRKICTYCKERIDFEPALEMFLARHKLSRRSAVFHKGAGCSQCRYSGYQGRVGIFEMLHMNEALRAAVSKGKADLETLRLIARENKMEGMFADGLAKAMQGVTTIEEVLRVVEGEGENV